MTRSSAPATWMACTELNISLIAPVTWLVASRLAARYFCRSVVASWAMVTTTTSGRNTHSVSSALMRSRMLPATAAKTIMPKASTDQLIASST
ncbi:hypothetical protein D3C73_1478210 [compost metagenome]